MIILLSLEESENQIISGVPEYVEFETNVPATVFYTLDGSEPDIDSDIAVDKVYLPTTGLSFTLKAVAISGAMSSDILEEPYFTDHTDLNKTRFLDGEGINVWPAGEEPITNLSFDVDGDDAQNSVIPFLDLDIKTSESNVRGEEIPNDSTVEFINFPDVPYVEAPEEISSPNNNNINFDPRANLIIIDGSTEEKIENQIVRIINRPHDSMAIVSKFYNEQLPLQSLVSSNFVRSMHDPRTGKIVYYYRDSRENRWMKSTQQIEDGPSFNLTTTAGPPQGFVFRWIEDRTMTKIF